MKWIDLFVLLLILSISSNAYPVGPCSNLERIINEQLDSLEDAPSKKGTVAETKAIDDEIEASKIKQTQQQKEILNSEAALKFKEEAKHELDLGTDANRRYIKSMKNDNRDKVLYFDVENSMQKLLNDKIFGEKTMVDALNARFQKNIYAKIKSDAELKAALGQEYRDYKSLRLKFKVTDANQKNYLENKLRQVYQEANKELQQELGALRVKELIPPDADPKQMIDRWFLAGVGDTGVEANMAARQARARLGVSGEVGHLSNFKDEVLAIAGDIKKTEKLRKDLALNKNLIESKILTRIDGDYILSKDMIGILRKQKPSELVTDAQKIEYLQGKCEKMFGYKPTAREIEKMEDYFKKVDSLSPPLFTRSRTLIDLSEAKYGMVSVDFTGVGVENAFEEMRGLATVRNTNEKNMEVYAKKVFNRMEKKIQKVTESIDMAKRAFSENILDLEVKRLKGTISGRPRFSGDDGMHLPNDKAWSNEDKNEFLRKLVASEDPSKYRITFVKTEYIGGKIIDAKERSNRIVRAESVEKELRELITGHKLISSEEGKKFMIAVDYSPAEVGGEFKIIVTGKVSEEQKAIIQNALKNELKLKNGEVLGNTTFQN